MEAERISSVDITLIEGKTWIPATINQSIDNDYVWVFWEVNYTPQSGGLLTIRSRATGIDGTVQPRDDDYNP